MTTTTPPDQGLVLSADEFEAALSVLVEEERRGRQNYAGRLISTLVFVLSCGVALFACPLGTLIRFFDPRVGQPLLIAGLVASAIFALLSTFTKGGGLLLSSDAIRAAAGLDNLSLDASVEAGWRKRTAKLNLVLGFLLIPGFLSVLGGLGWLLYSLFVLRTTSPISLVLIAWPLLVVFAFTAIRAYQEYVYFSRVAQLRSQFAARFVAAKRAEQTQVALSASEVSAFAQVQQRNINANVRQAVQQYAQTNQEAYAIVVAPAAQASLRRLAPEARAAMQNRIDALQLEPRPAEAEAAPSVGGQAYRVGAGDEALSFEVDDARQRVTVLAIGAAGAPETTHGA